MQFVDHTTMGNYETEGHDYGLAANPKMWKDIQEEGKRSYTSCEAYESRLLRGHGSSFRRSLRVKLRSLRVKLKTFWRGEQRSYTSCEAYFVNLEGLASAKGHK